jgi:acyl-coenzyme A thioesterase PaaI-like protein
LQRTLCFLGVPLHPRNNHSVPLDTKTDRCWVCGPENPAGLKVTFEPVGSNGSRARYVARDEHGGWPGVLHGGVLLALMDEALGWSLYFHGPGGFTARFDARFRRPTPIGANLVVRAWTLERRGRLVKARAEVRQDTDDGQLVAEADASMFLGEPES